MEGGISDVVPWVINYTPLETDVAGNNLIKRSGADMGDDLLNDKTAIEAEAKLFPQTTQI